ncbi:MAG TPA: hypothetical protein ENH07_02390 [Nitrospirae bacterium]|nr:hypothetical protein [Nitrospirota bacterium]
MKRTGGYDLERFLDNRYASPGLLASEAGRSPLSSILCLLQRLRGIENIIGIVFTLLIKVFLNMADNPYKGFLPVKP